MKVLPNPNEQTADEIPMVESTPVSAPPRRIFPRGSGQCAGRLFQMPNQRRSISCGSFAYCLELRASTSAITLG